MLSCEVSGNTIFISGDLRVQYLDSLGQCLHAGMTNPEPLELDLRAIYEVDTAGLQALLSFLRSRRQVGPVTISGYSEPMAMALGIMGLRTQFDSIADQRTSPSS